MSLVSSQQAEGNSERALVSGEAGRPDTGSVPVLKEVGNTVTLARLPHI